LIVAVGITAGLAAIMLSIVVNLLDTAGRASGSLVSSNQAQVALDFLAQDLESAVMRADGNVWLAATIQPDQTTAGGNCGANMANWTTGSEKPRIGVPGDAGSSLQLAPVSERFDDYRFGMAGVWVRMFSIEPDSNSNLANLSTVRAVGYQMVRYTVADSTGASVRYGLFRSVVRPYHDDVVTRIRSTFVVGYNLFALPYNDPAATIAGTSQTAGSGAAEPGGIRRPDRSLLVANNVVDFGVRFYGPNSNGDLQILFPISLNGGSANNHLGFAAWAGPAPAPLPLNPSVGAPTAAQMSYGFPTVAEVFLRVLSDEGAQILEAYERNPFPGKTWWDVALENSRVYTRRVEMKGRVL
jgi:hypothetical protein